jgi:alkanesulfonate monooxygenase SsuD/methylene tetrahydromethanopterin reductase-like flavin-dependent oxidoreductase (luciferase family)
MDASILPSGAATINANTYHFTSPSRKNQGTFEEGLEVVRKLWEAEGRISHHGRHYSFDDVRITPKPVQHPIPTYVASFSKLSIELAARPGQLICSYFTHFADTKEQELAQRAPDSLLQGMRDPGFPRRSDRDIVQAATA